MKRLTKLYVRLAELVAARDNCEKNGTVGSQEWHAKHTASAIALVREHMPSGSGWDNGTTLDFDRSTPDKLVLYGMYHHMTEGMYDGWTAHEITVRPSLVHGFTLTISGRNRNDIKDYLGDLFHECLTQQVSE